MNVFLQKTLDWFKLIVFFQAIAAFISTPILVYNGIGISNLALIGNIVFNPILVIFMFFSAIYFFAELIGFSATYGLIYCIEKLSDCWLFLLTSYINSCVFFLSLRYFFFIVLILVIASLLIMILRIGLLNSTIILYFLMLFLSLSFVRNPIMKILTPRVQRIKFCGKDLVCYINFAKNTVELSSDFDLKKVLRKKYLVDYELKPLLAKKFGCINFDFKKLTPYT